MPRCIPPNGARQGQRIQQPRAGKPTRGPPVQFNKKPSRSPILANIDTKKKNKDRHVHLGPRHKAVELRQGDPGSVELSAPAGTAATTTTSATAAAKIDRNEKGRTHPALLSTVQSGHQTTARHPPSFTDFIERWKCQPCCACPSQMSGTQVIAASILTGEAKERPVRFPKPLDLRGRHQPAEHCPMRGQTLCSQALDLDRDRARRDLVKSCRALLPACCLSPSCGR